MKENPFTKKAKARKLRGLESISAANKPQSSSSMKTEATTFAGKKAGPLTQVFGKDNVRDSQVDTSNVKIGQKIKIGWVNNAGEANKAEGEVTYADGLWINLVTLDGSQSRPIIYRPFVTSVAALDGFSKRRSGSNNLSMGNSRRRRRKKR